MNVVPILYCNRLAPMQSAPAFS